MQSSIARFEFSFDGLNAEEHQIDFYDLAQACIGFQRSLALTTHLVINGKVITKAPSLKGASIVALPPEAGSWKIITLVGYLSTGAYLLGTAPKDTPIGNLISSAYDYVISESLGFHVDYDETLGKQYEELQRTSKSKIPTLDQSRFDSVVEKCETAIIQMHRPISHSETAKSASITSQSTTEWRPIGHIFDDETYAHVGFNFLSEQPKIYTGKISSYNINTFKGRVFTHELSRPIPFELSENARTPAAIRAITDSLSRNALNRDDGYSYVLFEAFENSGSSGRVKSFKMLNVKTLQE